MTSGRAAKSGSRRVPSPGPGGAACPALGPVFGFPFALASQNGASYSVMMPAKCRRFSQSPKIASAQLTICPGPAEVLDQLRIPGETAGSDDDRRGRDDFPRLRPVDLDADDGAVAVAVANKATGRRRKRELDPSVAGRGRQRLDDLGPTAQ